MSYEKLRYGRNALELENSDEASWDAAIVHNSHLPSQQN
jgi:hypothetical protein